MPAIIGERSIVKMEAAEAWAVAFYMAVTWLAWTAKESCYNSASFSARDR